MAKVAASIRITPLGRKIMEALGEKQGISHSAIVDQALRLMARRERVGLTELKQQLEAEKSARTEDSEEANAEQVKEA